VCIAAIEQIHATTKCLIVPGNVLAQNKLNKNKKQKESTSTSQKSFSSQQLQHSREGQYFIKNEYIYYYFFNIL